jgi:DNA-binding MarR family transcriptional regulator
MPKVKPRSQPRSAVDAVADRLHSAAIHLLRRVRNQDTVSGEGPARLSALSVLVFSGSKTLGELAAAEQVKPPTMSRIVTGLKRSRLVEITADAHDARRRQIHATSKGVALLRAARKRRVSYLADCLSCVSKQKLARLRAALVLLEGVLRDRDNR